MPEHTPRIENAPYLLPAARRADRRGLVAGRHPELLADPGTADRLRPRRHPWDFTPVGTWFVTHGHIDHLIALPGLVARRGMLKYPPPVVHVPAEIVDRGAQPARRPGRPSIGGNWPVRSLE